MSAGGDELRERTAASRAVRVLVARPALARAVLVAIVLFAGDGGYTVTAEFVNAGQLVEGSEVRVAGSTVGTVEDIECHTSGTAEGASRSTTTTPRCAAAPRRPSSRPRCRASPTASSTSSSAPTTAATSRTAAIGTDQTQTAVELDEVFSLFDKETRSSLRDFIAGQADTLRGRGAAAAPGDPLPQPGAVHGRPPVRRADPRRPAARALPGRLGDAGERARRAARRPDRGRLEPEHHVRGARQPAGRAGRVGRAAAAVPAPRQHHLREPAGRARRRGPAGRRRQAGRAPARARSSTRRGCSRRTPSRPSATCRARSAPPAPTTT